MTQDAQFDQPNREGFESLIRGEFLRRDGMVFCASMFDYEDYVRLKKKGMSNKDIQKYFNHVHLFGYVSDVAVQREWANELKDAWAKTLHEHYPEERVHVDIEEDGFDVVVSLYIT